MRRRWLLAGGMVAVAAALTFTFAGEATGVVISGFFVDDNTSQFEDDIDAIAEAGITRGCDSSGTYYCPNGTLTRGEMAAFLRRSLNLAAAPTNFFTDDNGSPFEEDINAIAQAGITRGCDQAGTRFCPTGSLSRGEMAAFLRRSLSLPASATDFFADDNGSIFEEDINAIAEAGITRGCDATRTNYCLSAVVSRGAMAAFLRRSLDLPTSVLQIPMSDHPAMACPRSGNNCRLTVDLDANRQYRVTEGVFQAIPATQAEMAQFASGGTVFTLSVDGARVDLEPLEESEEDGLAYRRWEHLVSFSPGTHTLVGTWTWDRAVIRTTTLTVRAG